MCKEDKSEILDRWLKKKIDNARFLNEAKESEELLALVIAELVETRSLLDSSMGLLDESVRELSKAKELNKVYQGHIAELAKGVGENGVDIPFLYLRKRSLIGNADEAVSAIRALAEKIGKEPRIEYPDLFKGSECPNMFEKMSDSTKELMEWCTDQLTDEDIANILQNNPNLAKRVAVAYRELQEKYATLEEDTKKLKALLLEKDKEQGHRV